MINRYFTILFFSINFVIYSQTALDELELGKERLNNGDCKKAIIHFQQALKLNLNSLEAKIGYAHCSKKLGSFNDSKRTYLEVLQREPKNFEAVIGLSEINITLGELSEIPKRLDPLLDEFPNHTGLRILESKYLQSISKKDLAIHKLEKLSTKLNHPADVERMLGELYLASSRWSEAEDSLTRYTNALPSDPLGHFLKAELILKKNYFHVSKLLMSLNEAQENIQNALNLDPKHELARLLQVKLLVIEAYRETNLKSDTLEKAFKIIYELAREYPENKYYHSFEASIGEELGRNVFSRYHFRRALILDDLDEIGRFEAEEFALRNEKEESKLRRELSEYRKERYLAEKHSLYFKSAKFHLLRARDLNPQSATIRNELLEIYDLNGETSLFINLLLRFREENPDQFKLQNKLEFAIKSLKQSLESREGYIQIDNKGVIHKDTSSSPEVFVFDLESRVPFPEHYPGGRLLGRAFRYELKNVFNVRLPGDEEFSLIKNAIKEINFHPFTKTIPFSVEALHNLDRNRLNTPKIRYVLHGNYQFYNDTISVEISLYDRNTSKDIGKWQTDQKGRDSLSTLVARISEKVKQVLPIEGRILKIKPDQVLVSLGKRDGLKSNSVLSFERKGNLLMQGEIIELGADLCLVKPRNRGWEKELATGDFVTLHLIGDKDPKNK